MIEASNKDNSTNIRHEEKLYLNMNDHINIKDMNEITCIVGTRQEEICWLSRKFRKEVKVKIINK